jgi:beta-lactamase class A
MLLTAGVSIGVSAAPQADDSALIKTSISASRYQPYHRNLRAASDPALQAGLNRAISRLGLNRAVNGTRLSVALVDITDLAHPRYAEVNGDEMFYAASLPKIAILLGAFQKAADGMLRIDDYLRERMTEMIRYSSNDAATYVLKRVGGYYLARVLQSDRYRLYDFAHNGGLWVGKAYASSAAYQRDPLHNISHGATAYEVARFYYMLESGNLVSPQASREMKAILSDPGIHHKFVKGLEEAHPDAQLYRKSGTWGSAHADSAIVERNGRRYIAVALADDSRGGQWMTNLIVEMDGAVFRTAPKSKPLYASAGSAG